MRSLQLQEMGFSKQQSEQAIKKHKTVQLALEAMLLHSSSIQIYFKKTKEL